MAAIEHTENPSRKTFAFYWSFKDAIRDMPDADKLAVYEAITDSPHSAGVGRSAREMGLQPMIYLAPFSWVISPRRLQSSRLP